jgi:hypothetical protein
MLPSLRLCPLCTDLVHRCLINGVTLRVGSNCGCQGIPQLTGASLQPVSASHAQAVRSRP